MAASFTVRQHNKPDIKYVDLVCDSSYPAGGYPLTPADLGFTEIYGVKIVNADPGVFATYDATNHKLKILFGLGSGEVTAGDVDSLAMGLEVIGW